jgi:hypothetical protein
MQYPELVRPDEYEKTLKVSGIDAQERQLVSSASMQDPQEESHLLHSVDEGSPNRVFIAQLREHIFWKLRAKSGLQVRH